MANNDKSSADVSNVTLQRSSVHIAVILFVQASFSLNFCIFSLLPNPPSTRLNPPSASNPCEKNDGRGPCSHLCLINYNRTASCTCPHLMKLSPNKQSCFGESEPAFPLFQFSVRGAPYCLFLRWSSCVNGKRHIATHCQWYLLEV